MTPMDTPRAGQTSASGSEDWDLVQRSLQGDSQSFAELVRRYERLVFRIAGGFLRDRGEVEDVAQEVFLKVFRNVESFRGQSSLKTWIYRITVNEAHNHRRWFFRHRRNEVGLEDETEETRSPVEVIADAGRSPFDYVFDHEKHALIEAALARINPSFREAVVLRDISDLSYEEIAEVLQISLGTVKSRILRGREALRQELEGRLEPEPAMRLMPKTAE